jgi:hypothetical protein
MHWKGKTMIRNRKTLGLTLAAVLALGAVIASTASAQTQGKLLSDNKVPVTLTGEDEKESKNLMTAFGYTVKCPKSTYVGHKVGEPTQLIPHESTAATISPTYSKCGTTFLGATLSTTIDMRGCDYVFNIGQTTGNQTPTVKTFGVTADVVCPNAEGITISAYELTDSKHEKAPLCTVRIPPQKGIAGAHITSELTTTHFWVEGSFEKIEVIRKGSGVSMFCPTTELNEKTGVLDMEVKVQAHDKDKAFEGVVVND